MAKSKAKSDGKAIDTEEKETKKAAPAKKAAAKKEPAKAKATAKKEPKDHFSPELRETMELLGVTKELDDLEREFKLAASSVDTEARKSTCVSSGLLMTDLMLAGGIYGGGWYTILGPEGSCKTTHLMCWLEQLFMSDIPIIQHWDYEGSTTPDYMQSILEGRGSKLDVRNLFGQRHPDKPDEWLVEPRIRYYPESEGERFYKAVGNLLKRLPDKMCINGIWYLGFERTKTNISRLKGKYDTKLSTKYGRLMVESPNGGQMQALFILDSFPAMTAEIDDEGEGSNGLALDARMHSKHYKKVRSKLKRKNATLVGVNQVRLNPGARFGNPEYEPCGNAIKHASDARIRQAGRAIPHGTGQIEEEDSVLVGGGVDQYRYIHMRAVKNKLGVDNLEIWHRLWAVDGEGKGRGICPVWDTFQYLKSTGQCDGTMKKMHIKLHDGSFEMKKMNWIDFKSLILLTGKDLKEHCEEMGIEKNPRLREKCFKQVAKGDGMSYYFDTLNGIAHDDEDDDDDL
ncbi:protein RecA [Vibrio phage vB_VcorM_GR11A]|nr:protein RecA [Vibrio phage vB_VcorM_GR11A]